MIAKKKPCRRGAILVVTMVCLLISLAIVTTMLAGSLVQRRQTRVEHAARQAECLASAGVERALAALADDPDYDGETWSPELPEALAPATAEVRIELLRDESTTRLRVQATYQADADRPVRRGLTLPIPDLSNDPEG